MKILRFMSSRTNQLDDTVHFCEKENVIKINKYSWLSESRPIIIETLLIEVAVHGHVLVVGCLRGIVCKNGPANSDSIFVWLHNISITSLMCPDSCSNSHFLKIVLFFCLPSNMLEMFRNPKWRSWLWRIFAIFLTLHRSCARVYRTCIRIFLLNHVCSFHESNNKPNIYLEPAILVAVIFSPLQSVIHDRKLIKPQGVVKKRMLLKINSY
jgi:hypothetical protein